MLNDRGMCPHIAVHRWSDDEGASNVQQHCAQQIIRQTKRRLGQKICRRWCHKNGIGSLWNGKMRHSIMSLKEIRDDPTT
jgi:hypothetical protein